MINLPAIPGEIKMAISCMFQSRNGWVPTQLSGGKWQPTYKEKINKKIRTGNANNINKNGVIDMIICRDDVSNVYFDMFLLFSFLILFLYVSPLLLLTSPPFHPLSLSSSSYCSLSVPFLSLHFFTPLSPRLLPMPRLLPPILFSYPVLIHRVSGRSDCIHISLFYFYFYDC